MEAISVRPLGGSGKCGSGRLVVSSAVSSSAISP
jgi:hypothetical protein